MIGGELFLFIILKKIVKRSFAVEKYRYSVLVGRAENENRNAVKVATKIKKSPTKAAVETVAHPSGKGVTISET